MSRSCLGKGDLVKASELKGKKFGKWEALERVGSRHGGKALWKCRCECGAVQEILATNLVSENTNGCRQCALKASREARVKWNFGKYAKVPYGTARADA